MAPNTATRRADATGPSEAGDQVVMGKTYRGAATPRKKGSKKRRDKHQAPPPREINERDFVGKRPNKYGVRPPR